MKFSKKTAGGRYSQVKLLRKCRRKNYQRLLLLALLINTLAVTQIFAKEGIAQLKVNEEIIQIPKGLSK